MIGTVYQAAKIEFTAVLNAGLKWDDLERTVRDAFCGQVSLVKLRAGFRLYKFTQYDLRSAGGVTPWWSPHSAPGTGRVRDSFGIAFKNSGLTTEPTELSNYDGPGIQVGRAPREHAEGAWRRCPPGLACRPRQVRRRRNAWPSGTPSVSTL